MLEARPAYAALLCLGLLAIAGPWLAPADPLEQVDPAASRYRPPGTVLHEIRLADGRTLLADAVDPGDAEDAVWLVRHRGTELEIRVDDLASDGREPPEQRRYWLGTDKFGRDVLSRLLHGARLTLVITLLSSLIALVLGVSIGITAGLVGGWTDSLLMRLVDGIIAIPWVFLLVALAAVLPRDPVFIVLILGGTAWTSMARISRAETLVLREEPWMLAARGFGAGPVRRVLRHLLPNALPAILVEATLQLGILITLEASLSFLGLGIPSPLPSWGTMIAEARHDLAIGWWATVMPSLAVVSTVLTFHLAGDSLREDLNPRSAHPSEPTRAISSTRTR